MTQGLVTVMAKGNDTVAIKIVAGSDGMNAREVANAIRKLGRVPTLEQAYEIAKRNGLGSAGLVVLDRTKVISDFDEPLGELYRSTFDQPRFNPRWKHGTADYVEIVDDLN